MKTNYLVIFFLIAPLGAIEINTTQAQNPLEPLDFLVGGLWVGEFDLPNGQKIRQERTYEWSLDKQLIIGKTFRVNNDIQKQTRATVFSWNPEKQVIEFWDFIDTGGYGKGIVRETGKDTLYMEAEIIGSRHVDWRADFINKDGNEFISHVQVQQKGEWVDVGTFLFKKK